jgi:Cysteine-rich secretory protein family
MLVISMLSSSFAPASRFRHVSEIYLNLKILPQWSNFDNCAWSDCSWTTVLAETHTTQTTHTKTQQLIVLPRHTHKMLAAHNSLRHRLGVNQLSGSSKLDAEAQAWANTMASHSRMYHSGTPGENLYWSSSQSATAEDACRSWAAEERFWTGPGIAMQTRASGSAESKTGNWASVGHFTQMAWHRYDKFTG